MSIPKTKKLILIIEDDPYQRDIFRLALEHGGFAVVTKGDAQAGLNWLEQILPDLILLDCMLPGLSGPEMLAQLRKTPNGKTVPVVIATASSDIGPEDFTETGISDFLNKPIHPKELVKAIKVVLSPE